MAKSKSGGTRSYIRGRVGADVYSIGKDAAGNKQQVVRSLAETVSNPQTESQMRGRMIMSTVMQAVSAMAGIIDHSFDNVPNGQPNVSEFIRRNYALIKADVAAHPADGNVFGLCKYQEKGEKIGAYVISSGSANLPVAVAINALGAGGTITLGADAVTVAGLKDVTGLGADDYLTLAGFDANGVFQFVRLHINQSLSDETAIDSSNIASVFTVEGSMAPTISIATNVISILLGANQKGGAWIISKKTTSGYSHNEAVMTTIATPEFKADTALPTYPVGAQRFLNGGEL